MSTPRPIGEVLLIHKPKGWSSFQAVKKIKFASKAKRVGHAGTLDPLAEGLLIICTESQTKIIEQIQAQTKEYTGIITLGNTTPSYDLETEPNAHFPIDHITLAQIESVLPQFLGNIQQTPPLFSAVKVDGKRAYTLAREGIAHTLKQRTVHIEAFDITAFEGPNIHFRVVCSKGTYIRSLAFDLGKALGSGAHLSQLTRTRIGEYLLRDAITPNEFKIQRDEQTAQSAVTNPEPL